MTVSTPSMSIPASDPPRAKDSASSSTDDALARQISAGVAKGNESAFNQLYDRYHRRLFRLALSLNRGDETLAYDAAQSALLTAAAKLKPLQSEEHLWNWLARVARQHSNKEWRRQQREPQQATLGESVETRGGDSELEKSIDNALLALETEDRRAIEWFYFDGLSHKEIAGRTETTVKAVSSRLERARAKLRQLLAKERRDEN